MLDQWGSPGIVTLGRRARSGTLKLRRLRFVGSRMIARPRSQRFALQGSPASSLTDCPMAGELTGGWWRDRPMARRLLLIGFGVLLSLAYPRPEWPWLAWISLVPLFFFSMGVRPKQAFLDGFLFGFAFFTLLLRWLRYTFQPYCGFRS